MKCLFLNDNMTLSYVLDSWTPHASGKTASYMEKSAFTGTYTRCIQIIFSTHIVKASSVFMPRNITLVH